MKKEFKELLLTKKILVIDENDSKMSEGEIGTLLLSFSSLGYTLDENSIQMLLNNNYNLKDFYFESMELLKKAKGANADHVVFYKNFPNIENLSEGEMVLRALLHYYTVNKEEYGFMNQDQKEEARPVLLDDTPLTALKVVNEKEGNELLISYINALFEGKVAIPYYYLGTLELAFNEFFHLLAPVSIPFKENLAIYANLILKASENRGVSIGAVLTNLNLEFIKTSTDLLRIYVALSKGDITLKNNAKFLSLTREGRKALLNVLENICLSSNTVINDMAKREFLWKRALEKLHIGDYAKLYPHAYEVARELRNGDFVTYNSLIVSAYENKEYNKVLELLSSRPGIYARALDALLRNENFAKEQVLLGFEKIASKIASTLLLSLWEFYQNRNLYNTRIFVIKGENNFVKEVEDKRNSIDEETSKRVLLIIESALSKIYSSKEKIDKVYLDPCMKNYAIPTNNRNASFGAQTLTFGTRVKLENNEGNILRFFTHWKNQDNYKETEAGRVDIDLSLQLYDENFNNVAILAWHNLAGGKSFHSFHSGDVTTAPNGASEFIDLDYKYARENTNARYAIVINNVFTGQDFCDIPQCFSGIMFRKDLGKTGEIFEPKTVKYKYDLTQKGSRQNLAYVIDLKTMELIWTDYAYNYCQSYAVAANSDLTLVMILKKAIQKHMNLYELFKLHYGHLNFVDNKEEAKFIIDDNETSNVSTYDFEKIASEWL